MRLIVNERGECAREKEESERQGGRERRRKKALRVVDSLFFKMGND